MSTENLFFCCGAPKSGTTFLQRTLNLHPQISCPSEQHFPSLMKSIEMAAQHYNELLTLMDRRTGGQGASQILPETVTSTFCHMVLSIMRSASNGRPILGANDNSVRHNLTIFNKIFHTPKFIVIFRHPIIVAISSWHHNLRLAQEENNPIHTHIMEQQGGFEGWLKHTAQLFVRDVDICRKFSETNSNLLIVTYENLTKNKPTELTRILHFLGAAVTPEILKTITDQSSFENMKKTSAYPQFFRSGTSDINQEPIHQNLKDEIELIAQEALNFIYN